MLKSLRNVENYQEKFFQFRRVLSIKTIVGPINSILFEVKQNFVIVFVCFFLFLFQNFSVRTSKMSIGRKQIEVRRSKRPHPSLSDVFDVRQMNLLMIQQLIERKFFDNNLTNPQKLRPFYKFAKPNRIIAKRESKKKSPRNVFFFFILLFFNKLPNICLNSSTNKTTRQITPTFIKNNVSPYNGISFWSSPDAK